MNEHRIHVHLQLSPEIAALGNTIVSLLRGISKKQDLLMANMQDVRDAVARDTSVTQSAVTLLQGLSQQLKDALASNDPQAIQDVVNSLDANTNALAQAVKDNTPASSEPPPAPTPNP